MSLGTSFISLHLNSSEPLRTLRTPLAYGSASSASLGRGSSRDRCVLGVASSSLLEPDPHRFSTDGFDVCLDRLTWW